VASLRDEIERARARLAAAQEEARALKAQIDRDRQENYFLNRIGTKKDRSGGGKDKGGKGKGTEAEGDEEAPPPPGEGSPSDEVREGWPMNNSAP
jgi:hypothetical protein